jgi:multidrug efflux system membrane fusion protein
LRKALSAFLVPVCFCLSACNKKAPSDSSAHGSQGGHRGRGAQMGNMPIPVGVAPVKQEDTPVFLSGLGTVTAYYTVSVKSRVDGEIIKVNFREGQHVNKGEVLAEIDPRPYQVQLATAEGQLARDQAMLNTARIDLRRNEELTKAGVVAVQQLDTQRATTGQYQGTVQADQAAIDSAKLNLVYSKITAPITGRIGLRQVDPGNIVHATDTSGIATITQMQPIAVIFTLPEDNVRQVRERMRQGVLTTQAWTRDDAQMISTGKLETIDNQIDTTTGTVKLKAVFQNPKEELWPNQFVNVHLQLQTLKNAIVVPTSAVQRGPNGTFVYSVGADKKAHVTPVQVHLTEGLHTVIASGLAPGDQVVTDGQEKLQEGALVDARAPQHHVTQGGQQGSGDQGVGQTAPGA